ncbi:MAG: TSUP family transporter [Chloroflexi bacterium]|nr:TSUP family transporter [Chloroflexota bacterium]
MDLLIVALAAAGASALTLFTGFGLGTLLTPLFVLFLPVPLAIAVVAVVHLANNVFKLALVGRYANGRIALSFGLPGLAGALAGAALLVALAGLPVLAEYDLLGRHEVSLVKLIVGLVIVAAAVAELRGPQRGGQMDGRRLVLGGVGSGFVGGLTGSQGPLRAAVLIRAGLDPQAYIGTNAVCAVLVDVGRLAVYGSTFASLSSVAGDEALLRLVVIASLSAFAGALAAARLASRATSSAIRLLTAGLMVAVGAGLAAGFV